MDPTQLLNRRGMRIYPQVEDGGFVQTVDNQRR